jgi:hypothetical protein
MTPATTSVANCGNCDGEDEDRLPCPNTGMDADGSRWINLCHVEVRRVESSPLLSPCRPCRPEREDYGVITSVATDRVFPDGSLIAGLRVSKAMTRLS